MSFLTIREANFMSAAQLGYFVIAGALLACATSINTAFTLVALKVVVHRSSYTAQQNGVKSTITFRKLLRHAAKVWCNTRLSVNSVFQTELDMMKSPLLSIFVLLSICGCSTHMTKIEYEGTGNSSASNQPTINSVIVTDQRGTESNWLGAIRGGYGNVLKTLKTEESTDIMVDKIFTDALSISGILYDSKDAPYKLQIVITKFDCSYYFNREAHAHVEASLIDNRSSQPKFSKAYKTDKTEGGVGAGVFGDVDTLRNLAETAMNETVDKMLNDPEFIQALEPENTVEAGDRLHKLELLYQSGQITDEEYRQKRKDIISEL
jgi:YajG family uncharacterized lipoprotein/putative oligomerization/nucleic acid binding protein